MSGETIEAILATGVITAFAAALAVAILSGSFSSLQATQDLLGVGLP